MSRRNPITAGDVLHVSAAAEETQLPPVRVCETTQVAYQADAQISCTVKPSGFLVRESHWTTSLCTGSAEINSSVWQVCPVSNERSCCGAFSAQLELFFELSLIALGADCISGPNEGQRQTVLSLLIPEHESKACIIVTAVDLDLSVLLHYLWRRLLKSNSSHLTCREKSRFNKMLLILTEKINISVS